MVAAEVAQSIGKDLLGNITKALGLFASLTYIMGLIVVNSFLLTFGIRTTSLVSAEYISAALPLALLFLVAGLTGGFFNRAALSRRAKVAILAVSIVLLGLIMLYITNLADYSKTLRTTGIIFVILFSVSFAAIRHFSRRLIGSRERMILWSAVYGLIFLALVVALSTFYGRTVYDDILSTVGGGAGSTVSFVTDAESGIVLGELVPMLNEVQTQPIRLIRETDESYLIFLTDETSVSVDKDLVKGIIHHKTSGWEIKSSVFD